MRKLSNTCTQPSRGMLVSLLLVSFALVGTACGPGSIDGGPPPAGSVRIEVIVTGGGQAWSDQLGFACRDRCTVDVPEGSRVSLTAMPDTNRVLVAWDGQCGPFGTTCSWEASDGDVVTLTFAPHALRLELVGDGEGRFEVSGFPATTTCRESCGVPYTFTGPPRAVAITYFSEGTRTTVGPWTGACEGVPDLDYCLTTVSGAVDVGTTWLHPPVASDHTFATDQGEELVVAAPGVLRNIDDTPGDTHTATLVTPASHGTVTVSLDGAFSYDPEPDFSGPDGFTYRARDAFGNTDVGEVFITVRPPGDAIGDVTVTPTSATLDVDDAIQLTATVDVISGNPSTDVTWSSDDNDIATVDATGTVTGIGPGTATITATSVFDTDVSGEAEITVDEPDLIGDVTITPASASITVAQSVQLEADVNVVSGDPTTDVTWTSGDATIATVDADGLVTGVAAGTTTITATSDFDSNFFGDATITVANVVALSETAAVGLTDIDDDRFIVTGEEFSFTFTATDGLGDYTFSDDSGFTGTDNGDGTYTVAGTAGDPGDVTFTVTVEDEADGTADVTVEFTVVPALLASDYETIDDAEVGDDITLLADVSGGLLPYTFMVTVGTLPPGVELDLRTGTISGNPTISDPDPFVGTVTVTDALDQTNTLEFSITVTNDAIAVGPSSGLGADETAGVAFGTGR